MHKKSSKAKKSIPGPKTTKISSRMWKCKRLNRMCMEKNLEKQPPSLERSMKDLSKDIKNSQIGHQMLKICLLECKIEPLNLITEKSIKNESKIKKYMYHYNGLETRFLVISCLWKMSSICPRYEQKCKGRSKEGLRGKHECWCNVNVTKWQA